MEYKGFDSITRELVAPEIEQMLANGKTRDARESLIYLFDPEIAEVLGQLPPQTRAMAFRLLPRDRTANVLTFLHPDQQEEIIKELTNEQLANVFNSMEPDDRVEVLDELPGQLVAKLLKLMRPEERRETQIILGYPPESIGRLMTPDYVRVKQQWDVARALDHVRRYGREAETLDTLYVVDEHGHLLYGVELRELLLANRDEPLKNLLDMEVIALQAHDDREEAVRAMERFDRPVLPVVDRDGVLVGIVTFDDVADVAEEEVTEDIQKMAGIEALNEPYISASLPTLVRKRGVWLSILFLGQMITVSVMEFFEAQISAAEVLIAFIPLIISSGGNSGSQATSLIIRGLAIGEIKLRDWWRIMQREFACGLLLGGMLGLIGLARVQVWQHMNWADYTAHHVLVGFTIALSLVGIVLWGVLVGSMLPLLLRRLGLDPATSSAPFVTTVVDVTGLVIYFTTAILLLRGTVF